MKYLLAALFALFLTSADAQFADKSVPSLAGAWTAYTPTLACGTGTLTASSTAGRFKIVDKTTFVQFSATLTTLGTCSGSISVSLPSTAQSTSTMVGRESGSTGVSMIGVVVAGASVMGVTKYDGLPIITAGFIYIFNGTYENQ